MISKFSVKRPYTVFVGVILILVLGVVSFTRMTADLLPDINLPYVVIMTTYPGASPETVEMAVTKPIESAMATVSNIEEITSTSGENYSMVILEFSQTTNMDSVSLEIREKLDQIKGYWEDAVGNPVIMKLNPDMLPVMIAAVGVEDMEENRVSDYVENEVMPEIESIEGVASVSVSGLIEESLHVVISQEKLDQINEKIRDSITASMEDAQKELEDGKKELDKSRRELTESTQKLADGKSELQDGKDKLNSGKKELENQKGATAAQLAEAEQQLLTAKTDLEASKVAALTEQETIKQLEAGRVQAKQAADQLAQAVDALQGVLALTDENQQQAALQALLAGNVLPEELKTAVNGILQDSTGFPDWQSKWSAITGILTGAQTSLQEGLTTAREKEAELEAAISARTNTLGAEAYLKLLSKQLSQLNEQIAKVDEGLSQLSQGKLTAAIEFANAGTKLELSESQIQSAEAQLEASESQIEAGRQQLDEAQKQLQDGEEQLEDARTAAFEQADLTEILTVDTVQGLLIAQNFSMPVGYVQEEGNNYLVRIGDKPEDLEEVKALPLLNLHMDGVGILTLEDVADVFYTDNSDQVYTNVNGVPGVMLTIQKQTGYSTGEVSDKLQKRFEELMERNDKLTLTALMDQGIYIDLVMDSIVNNVLVGALLAVLILILFLRDMKPTLVIACSIPISLITAIVCMYFSGVTLNIISLSGLALGVGMLVDNSIVVIENIYRMRSEGRPLREAAVDGAGEVAGAIISSTLTTVCVFLPIVFTEGITRQLFVDMGLTIAYSLFASLLIALTVVPAMASGMLKKTRGIKESKIFSAIQNGYSKALEVCLKGKAVVLFLVFLLLGLSFFAAISRGTAFMPDMDSTQFNIHVQMDDKATLADTKQVTDTLIDRILQLDEIEDVGAMSQNAGSSLMLGTGDSDPGSAYIYVTKNQDASLSNEELAQVIKEQTEDLPAEITIDTSSMDMSAMGGSGVQIRLMGKDLDTLRQLTSEVAEKVKAVEGIAEVSDGIEEKTEEFRISIDKRKAMEYGLTVAQIYTQLQPKLAESQSVTTLEEAAKDYGVYVIRDQDEALTRQLLQSLTVEGTDQDNKTVKVPLEELADFQEAEGVASIQRMGQKRYMQVSATLAEGYNIGLVSQKLEAALKDYSLPDGYTMEFSGENETINDAMKQLMLMLLLALVFMYLIMVAQFQSLLHPFIIMFTIPLAFTGGLFGLFFTGSEVSVVAVIGFVMLSGIIVNNGIVLIDYINQLRENGVEKREAILTAGRTRLRPVLMTALTTILAMSSMVFSKDMGSEMAKPMAVVTVGGLLYGTLLTLIVIPCVYDIFTGKRKEKE